MSSRAARLPGALRGRAFNLRQAEELGVPPSRLRANDLRRPFAGVRAAPLEPAAPDIVSLAREYAVKMGPGEFFSHATAGLLHGMWLPLALRRSGVLDVSVRKPARAPRDRGVRGHHLIDRPVLVVLRHGLPTASAVETWCQLATQLVLPDLVAAGESLLTPERTDVDVVLGTLVAAARDPNRPVHVRLDRAAALLRPGVRSPKETELRLLLLAGGLPEPEVNVPIRDERGRWVAECDLVYPGAKVLLEYEGDGHRTTKEQFRRDIGRYDRLQDLGWRVIRVTQEDLDHPADLLDRVRRALSRA